VSRTSACHADQLDSGAKGGAGTVAGMRVHLVDGTYELFRQHFGSAGRQRDGAPDPGPYAATIGVLGSTLGLVEDGATHIGVASDHVIESFRNDLWPGYKTSEGMPPELLHQIPVVEDALVAMGVVTWAMVEHEADDALGAAAAIAAADPRVEQVLIVTPDKDLCQCVSGTRVVQFDRRKREILDEAGVVEKFGIAPASIPDYLGLVGDTADGYPGLPGWGAKSAASVLARYGHIEDIPPSVGDWDLPALRGSEKLASTLRDQIELALLFRRIATVELDVDVGNVDDWRWTGPTARFGALVQQLGGPELVGRAERAAVRAASRATTRATSD
jgi:5'-3' exonuclease